MAMYGGYEFTENGNEETAKEKLKKEIHKAIDNLCEIDQFWIVKENAPGIPEGEKFVGWKIDIPQITYKRVIVAMKNGKILKDCNGNPRIFESIICALSLLEDGEWDEIKSIVIDEDADLNDETTFADFEIKVVEEYEKRKPQEVTAESAIKTFQEYCRRKKNEKRKETDGKTEKVDDTM